MAQILIGSGASQISTYSVAGSFQNQQNVGEHSGCSFDILDTTGQWSFVKGQPITVNDAGTGDELFTGFISDAVFVKYGSTGGKMHTITCTDNTYLAQKLIVARTYQNELAGDILSALVDDYFAAEGVIAQHINNVETSQADFQGGTYGWQDTAAENLLAAYTASQAGVYSYDAANMQYIATGGSSGGSNPNALEDDFTRANTAAGWGNSTNTDSLANYAWAGGADGTNSNIFINGDTAVDNEGAATGRYCCINYPTTSQTGEVLAMFNLSAVGATQFGVCLAATLSGSTTTSAYAARINTNAGTNQLIIQRRVASSNSTITNTNFTLSANTDYWIRFRVEPAGGGGFNLYVRVWADSGSEPISWTLTGVDTGGSYPVAGIPGVLQNWSTAQAAGSQSIILKAFSYAVNPNTAQAPDLGSGAGGGGVSLTRQNMPAIADMTMAATFTQAAKSRVFARYVDTNNWYAAEVKDSVSGNTIQLAKNVAGTLTYLGSAIAISFARGTANTASISVVGTTITAYFNGTQKSQVTDSSITGSGYGGVGHAGGTTSTLITSMVLSHTLLEATTQGDGALQLMPTGTPTLYNDTTTADFAAGTLVNLSTTRKANSLQITGYNRDWDDNAIAGQTFFNVGGASQQAAGGQYIITTGTGKNGKSRLDNAGSYANFTAEFDCVVPATGELGFIYRTTGWQAAIDTYAYNMRVTPTAVALGRGTNTSTGAGSFTSVLSATHGLATGTAIHVKIVINGTSHQASLNGTLVLNATDSTYAAAGQMGLRAYNSTSDIWFDNFGVIPQTGTLSGTFTKVYNPQATGTAAASFIAWDVSTPTNTSITVQAAISTNNGTSYGSFAACTNGGSIPGITSAMSLTSVLIKIQITLTTTLASATPDFQDITISVNNGTAAKGYRLSPSIDLSKVDTASTAAVSWTASTPLNTALAVDVSYDSGVTWLSCSNGATLPTINLQSIGQLDSFTANSSAEYAATGGTWSYDLVNFRLNYAGFTQFYIWNTSLGSTDMTAQADIYQGSGAGVIVRYQDSSNYYRCYAQDTAHGGNAAIVKAVAGVQTTIFTTPVNFTPQTIHRIALTVQGSTLTFSFDGQVLTTMTDTDVTSGTFSGLIGGGGATNTFAMFSAQSLGTSLASYTNVQFRQTLSSTQSGVTPVLNDMTVNVRTWAIQDGPLISSTVFGWQPGDACIQALADAAGFWWRIDESKRLIFQARTAVPAPWTATGDDLILDSIKIESNNPLYRNRQYVIGGYSLTNTQTDTRQGDGHTNTFTMSYDLAQVPTVQVNIAGGGWVSQTVGIKGIDDQTNADQWYWNEGDNTITQDTSGTVLNTGDLLQVTYVGRFPSIVVSENITAVTAMQTTEGGTTTGFVDAVETANENVDSSAMTDLANSLLSVYGTVGRTVNFQTRRTGLAPGQLLFVYLPDYDMNYVQCLIGTVEPVEVGPVLYYNITAYEGPVIGTWVQLFEQLMQQMPLLVNTVNVGSSTVLTIPYTFNGSISWTGVHNEAVYTGTAPSTSLYPSTTLYPI